MWCEHLQLWKSIGSLLSTDFNRVVRVVFTVIHSITMFSGKKKVQLPLQTRCEGTLHFSYGAQDLRKIYPNLSAEELVEAERNLEG